MTRKRESAHADERWLLTYADMITLLMALFMVLFSIAVINKGKFNELAQSLHESFDGPLTNGGSSIISVGSPTPAASTPTSQNSIAAQGVVQQTSQSSTAAAAFTQATALQAAQAKGLMAAKQAIDRAIARYGEQRLVTTIITPNGLLVRIVSDQLLFDVGSSNLRSQSLPLLAVVASAINAVATNPIRVNGYTDAIPYNGDPHGNERLSTSRANSVLFSLEDHGFSVTRHPDTEASGYGQRDPLVPNGAGGNGPANRRVEVLVERIDYVGQTRAAANGPIGLNPVGLPSIVPAGVKISP